ncbi:type I secretion protein [Rhodobacter capsulatus]|uniref:Type I secretion protein n=1 Tax=Rhodobacter capsulatus TaxID=1061 RepID=A0A4U1JP65_RHOCA|nr:Hint domain-containing protein [Rhodobacter capsulatus]TKD17541.1 type I secretion protein [Rhodobacter capsulatus]
MSITHRLGAGQAALPVDRSDPSAGLPARKLPLGTPKAPRATPLTRRYESAWLTAAGTVETSTRLAPATPLFEEAFSALARGSVLMTEDGPVAIEDLQPGQRVLTAEGRAEQVCWIGSMVIYPGAGNGDALEDHVSLTRITAEAFGAGRPGLDLVLGPRARLCLRDPRLRRVSDAAAAYVPARAFLDGISVIEVSPSVPVTVYHVVLEHHGSLRVAGLEVEAFHPGEGVERMIDPRMLSLFEAQFPQFASLAAFGPPAHPRLTRFEVESLWE